MTTLQDAIDYHLHHYSYGSPEYKRTHKIIVQWCYCNYPVTKTETPEQKEQRAVEEAKHVFLEVLSKRTAGYDSIRTIAHELVSETIREYKKQIMAEGE